MLAITWANVSRVGLLVVLVPLVAIGQTNSDARLERLARWLKSTDEEVRLSAVKELAGVRSEAGVTLLLQALEDANPVIRTTTAQALKSSKDPRVIEPLRRRLGDESGAVRGMAAWALSYVGGKQVLPDLLKLAQEDADGVVRFRAVWGLGIVGDKSALPVAVDALTDENPTVRERGALLAIAALRDETLVGRLIEKSRHPRTATRRIVMYLLGRYGDATAAPVLEQGLKDDQPLVRAEAALALGRMKAAGILDALRPSLSEKDEHVRGSAAYALELAGDPAAMDVLRPLLKDKSAFVRAVAAEALQSLGDASAKPPEGFRAVELFTYPIYNPDLKELYR